MRFSEQEKSRRFVQRQLAFLAKEANFDFEIALSRIESSGNENTREAVQYLRGVFNNNTAVKDSTLAVLVGLSKPEAKAIGTLLLAYDETKKEFYEGVRALLASQKIILKYCITICVVAFLVFSLMVVKVLPEFEEAFKTFGYDHMPGITLFMLKHGELALIFALSMVALSLYGLFYSHTYVLMRVKALLPLPSNLFTTVFFGAVKSFNSYLLASYARMILIAGAAPQTAMDKSREMITEFGACELDFPQTCQMSVGLNTLPEELEHQLTELSQSLVEDATSHRQKIQQIYQVILALLVGALVISMYLPIFTIGEAI